MVLGTVVGVLHMLAQSLQKSFLSILGMRALAQYGEITCPGIGNQLS